MKKEERLKKELEKTLDKLHQQLGEFVSETGDGELIDFLKEDPAISAEVTGTGQSLAQNIYLGYRMSHPERDADIKNVKLAIYRMQLEGLGWLFDHAYHIDSTIEVCKTLGAADSRVEYLRKDSELLKEWINEVLWDRVQVQESHIKEMDKEAAV